MIELFHAIVAHAAVMRARRLEVPARVVPPRRRRPSRRRHRRLPRLPSHRARPPIARQSRQNSGIRQRRLRQPSQAPRRQRHAARERPRAEFPSQQRFDDDQKIHERRRRDQRRGAQRRARPRTGDASSIARERLVSGPALVHARRRRGDFGIRRPGHRSRVALWRHGATRDARRRARGRRRETVGGVRDARRPAIGARARAQGVARREDRRRRWERTVRGRAVLRERGGDARGVRSVSRVHAREMRAGDEGVRAGPDRARGVVAGRARGDARSEDGDGRRRTNDRSISSRRSGGLGSITR